MSARLPERYTLAELEDRRSCALCGKRLGATDGICYACRSAATIDPTEAAVGICPECGGDAGSDALLEYACECGAVFSSTVVMETEEAAITLGTDAISLFFEER